MTSNQDKVIASAAFLDKYGPLGWREKVNADKLTSASPSWCLLAQVYGSCTTSQAEVLRKKDGWCDTQFHSLDAEWKEYLKTPVVKAEGLFQGRSVPSSKVAVEKRFEVNGKKYVVFSEVASKRVFMKTETDFNNSYQPVPAAPKYIDGQLYKGKWGGRTDTKNDILLYGEKAYYSEPGFYSLNAGTRGPVEFHERENGGELKPATIMGSIFGKSYGDNLTVKASVNV